MNHAGWRPILPYPLLVLHGHDAPVTSVSVSCDLGIIISGSEDGTAIVYSSEDGAYIRTIGKSSIYKSPDIATSHVERTNQRSSSTTSKIEEKNDIHLTVVYDDDDDKTDQDNMENGKNKKDKENKEDKKGFNSGAVTWVGSTSSGGFIVLYFGNDMLLRVYTLNGKLLSEIEINERLNAFLFSDDGNYLITGGSSRLVKVRDIHDSLNELPELAINGYMKSSPLVPNGIAVFESEITSLSLTTKERHLIVGLSNGCVRILALNAQYLRDRLQERLSSLGF